MLLMRGTTMKFTVSASLVQVLHGTFLESLLLTVKDTEIIIVMC